MKKHSLIFTAAALAILPVACQKNAEQPLEMLSEQVEVQVNNAGTPEEYLQLGIINVKITPAFAAQVEAATDEAGRVDVKSVRSMGATVEDLGIVTMERLFPDAGEFEARTRAEGLHLWYTIRFDENRSITRASGDLASIPGIAIVDPVPVIRIVGDPQVVEDDEPVAAPSAAPSAASNIFNDPDFPKQWHYYNDGSFANAAQSGCDVNVVPVWKSYTTGNPDVVVSVVDGGIDYNHEDLAGNMWHDPEDERRCGFNFCTNNYALTPHSHGTHVAGTIAAVNNNGIGVCGIAGGDAAAGEKGVRLMSCQIFSEDGKGGSGEQAIKWGADHGAVISQNSWGLTKPCETPASLKAAVDYFIKYAGFDANGKQVGPMAGGLVIFAAGNDDSSAPYGVSYEKMLIVSSVGPDYVRAYYSNYGDWTHIAAPGGDAKKGCQVYSTLPGNSYGKMQGTSMACPHVSGVAALVLSKKGGPGFSNTALRDLLVNNTTDISAYNRNYYLGTGLVNAYRAIAGSGGEAPEKVTGFTVEQPSSNTVNISAVVPSDADDGKPSSILVYYSTKTFSSTEGLQFSSFYVNDTKVGKTVTGKITGLDFRTKYYFAAVACDLAGNKSPLSELKSVMTGENHAPVVETSDPTNLTLKTFQTAYINYSVSEPDDHFVSLALNKASEAETLDTLVMDKPKIRIEGIKGAPGTYKSSFVVTDVYGLSTTKDFTYTILDNVAPKVVGQIPDQIFSSKSADLQLNAEQYFTDEDGEPLSYEIVNDNEAVMNVNYSKGIIYLTAMGYGYANVTVTVKDAKGASASQSFKVLVRDGSEPVDIYPNPVSDFLYVRTSENATASLKLVNTMGASVYDKELEITPFSPAKVDVKSLPAGSYTVVLDYNGTKTTKTVVKL